MLRNFSWVIDGELAGSAWPGRGGDLAKAASELRAQGVGLVVTLTQQPLDPEILEAEDIARLHLPVPDFSAPTPSQLREFVTAADACIARKRGVVAHCAAGIGRAGTCLAVYLVHRGMDPEDAITQLRELRPGSIESPEQLAAVRAFGA